jgi:predicted Fe-Mo cluster-binding NifX family protein
MKIAITSTGNTMESLLDERFGRCIFFVFYDNQTGGIEFLPNPNREIDEGAGEASVKIISERKVEKIISGEFGVKIKPLLDSLQIQMIMLKKADKTIQDIVNLLNQKK